MAVDHNSDENRLLFLAALECAGVDNWSGWDTAMEIYNEMLKEQEKETQ